MTVLRSRKVVSVIQNEHSHKSVENGARIEPSTPAKEIESNNKSSYETTPSPVPSSDKLVSNQGLRRSARLSSKSSSSLVVENVSSRRKRKVVNHGNGEATSVVNGSGLALASGVEKESVGSESVISNLRASSECNTPSDHDNEEAPSLKKVKSRRLLSQDFEIIDPVAVQEGDGANKTLNLRSGKKLAKPVAKNAAKDKEVSPCQDEKETEEGESDTVLNGGNKTLMRFSREDKQKGVLLNSDDDDEEMEIDDAIDTIKSSSSRLVIEENGEGKASEVDSSSNNTVNIDSHVNLQQETIERAGTSTGNKEMFKKIARQNATRFAYFHLQQEEREQEEEALADEDEPHKDVEDWPGPFSTAMKIIKDRASNTGQQSNLTSEPIPVSSVPLTWVPKVKQHDLLKKSRPSRPSLQELCMSIMAENVDAITSLESVPDVLRHKLTQLLCDRRKMNHHFFDLLANGSPSEIRVRDCSWLSEEQLTKTFQTTDTSKLTVLQLDQCGRCLPDYVLFTTLAHSNFSELTNISLRGACRLSDAGLNVLLTSAPSLRSINLGCCSLLTSDGIINLADKLRSKLKELYIDECFGLDAKQILPALLKLEGLEVLSISRFETVNDTFIKQLVGVRGHSIKELVLADCPKLTDKSLKAIAESCPGLCSVDLSSLCKLTDTAIGHLANGCRGIQTMKFCRNAFSDEAVAAYLEACGQSLKELSLNHVDKVGNHTALSLAKHARNLQSLDLSWCRNMTNEAVGLIVDSCSQLKTLKLFGCTQITNVFLDGHSNEEVKVIGLRESQILKNIEVADLLPLRFSSAA